jgi:hypothetical protein
MGTHVLSEVLANADKYDEYLDVYVADDRDPVPESEVELVDYEGPHTPKPPGKRCLLGIDDIRIVLDTWSKWRGGRTPSDAERCEAVTFYAKYDSYLPVE